MQLVARDETNYDGTPILRIVHLGSQFRHLSFWQMGVFFTYQGYSEDDRSTRGGPLIIRPRQLSANLSVSSDPRKPITGGVNVGLTEGEFGGDAWEASVDVTWRTAPRWNLSIGPYVSRGRIAAQYLATVPDQQATQTFGRRYVFAPLDFTNVNANIRLNVTFAPRLTLEAYAQPLIFASDYGAPGALVAPRTFRFEPFAGLPSLDNTLHSLRGNAVLRWEYRPGSAIYLAWQQTRQGVGDSGDFRLSRDPRALLEARPDNTVVLKAVYWLNF